MPRPRPLVLAAVLALTLPGCGGDEGATGRAPEPPVPQVQVDALTTGTTQLVLDSAFADGLTTLGVTPGALGAATATGRGIRLPVTGGSLTYYEPGAAEPHVQGLVRHAGAGLSLRSATAVLELTDLELDPGASSVTGDVTADGRAVVRDAPLFRLDGSTLQPLRRSGDEVVLAGARVLLTQGAADLLNSVFTTTVVQEAALVGSATLTLRAPD